MVPTTPLAAEFRRIDTPSTTLFIFLNAEESEEDVEEEDADFTAEELYTTHEISKVRHLCCCSAKSNMRARSASVQAGRRQELGMALNNQLRR